MLCEMRTQWWCAETLSTQPLDLLFLQRISKPHVSIEFLLLPPFTQFFIPPNNYPFHLLKASLPILYFCFRHLFPHTTCVSQPLSLFPFHSIVLICSLPDLFPLLWLPPRQSRLCFNLSHLRSSDSPRSISQSAQWHRDWRLSGVCTDSRLNESETNILTGDS